MSFTVSIKCINFSSNVSLFHQMYQVYQVFHQVFVLSTLSGFTHDSKLMIEKIDLMKHLTDLMKHLTDLMKHHQSQSMVPYCTSKFIETK
jgi:hypothetical protein